MPRIASILSAVILGSLVILTASADQKPGAAHPHVQSRFVQAAAITSEKGFSAKLPPHIATLLRLTTEQECPVKQSVTRNGGTVQGLDVSVSNKADIVLFVVDENTHQQSLFLTSPEGNLRRVVKVANGIGSEIRITDKERQAFQHEKQYWIDHLVTAAKSAPNPTK